MKYTLYLFGITICLAIIAAPQDSFAQRNRKKNSNKIINNSINGMGMIDTLRLLDTIKLQGEPTGLVRQTIIRTRRTAESRTTVQSRAAQKKYTVTEYNFLGRELMLLPEYEGLYTLEELAQLSGMSEKPKMKSSANINKEAMQLLYPSTAKTSSPTPMPAPPTIVPATPTLPPTNNMFNISPSTNTEITPHVITPPSPVITPTIEGGLPHMQYIKIDAPSPTPKNNRNSAIYAAGKPLPQSVGIITPSIIKDETILAMADAAASGVLGSQYTSTKMPATAVKSNTAETAAQSNQMGTGLSMLPGYSLISSKPVSREEAHSNVLLSIETQRVQFAEQYRNAMGNPKEAAKILAEAGSYMEQAIAEEIVYFWYGTGFDRAGMSDSPNSGRIACSYFVATMLNEVGFEIDRVKLAQQSALNIAKTLGGIHLKHYTAQPEVIKYLEEKGKGLYIIGFSHHAGFLYNDGNEQYLIHASPLPPSTVARAVVRNAPSFEYSKVYDVARLGSNETLIKYWLSKSKIPIVTR